MNNPRGPSRPRARRPRSRDAHSADADAIAPPHDPDSAPQAWASC